MKLFDYIKLGFGFYIGFEVAKLIDKKLGVTTTEIVDRIKKGY